MNKILLLVRKRTSACQRFLFVGSLVLLMMGMANKSQAQVYYSINDSNGSTTGASDAVLSSNYDGSSPVTKASSFASTPTLMALDIPGNRAFVYSALTQSIKVVDMGGVNATIDIPVPNTTIALQYDPASDFIYYLTTNSNFNPPAASTDAIRKVKPNNTGDALVLGAITAAPAFMALDLPRNRVFLVDQSGSSHLIKNIDLTSGVLNDATPLSFSSPIAAVSYDPNSDYIYYLISDNSVNTSAGDYIGKVQPGQAQSTAVTVADNVAAAPNLMALDLGHNRIYVYDNLNNAKKINAVTGSTTATIINITNALTVKGLGVPNTALLTTTAVGTVTSSSAVLGGSIASSDLSVTERGVVYSSSNNPPTTSDSKASNGNGTGTFSAPVGSLSGSTTYNERAYAISGAGTTYGAVKQFTTLAAATTITGLVIKSGSATITNASSVQYTATFGAAVTGLTTSNFSVSGVTGASVTGVAAATGNDWTITVGTGTGSGTLALSMANASGATPSVSNTPFAATSNFIIDKTAPAISISAPSLSDTNTGPVSYTITYSDANFNSSTLAPGNIIVNNTASGGSIAVTGTGLTRTVTLSSITGSGTLGISITAGTATDLAGNSAPAAGPSTTFNVDNVAPTATITRAGTSPTNASSVTFNIKFSEPVTGANSGQFNISASSGIDGFSVGTFSGSGDTYSYTLNGITEDAVSTITLDLDGGSNIKDAAGNVAAAATGETYTIDQIAPTVAITRANGNPTNASSVTFNIKFNKTVTGVDASDFSVAGVGVNSYSQGPISGSGDTYSLTVSSITGVGTVGLNLNGGTDIKDAAGNVAVGAIGEHYDIDQAAPTVASVSAPVSGTYGVGGILSFVVHFTEPVNVTGQPQLGFTMDSGNANAVYSGGTGTADLTFHYSVVNGDNDPNGITISSLALNSGTIADVVGNNADLTLNSVEATNNVLVDAVPPVVTSIQLVGAATTNATSADFTVKFSKPVTGVSASNFSAVTTGTVTGTATAISSGMDVDTYTITVTGVSGDGTLGLNFNAAGSGIFDDNSNQVTASFTGTNAYTIDNTAPAISISAPSVASVGAGAGTSVTYDITYSDTNFNSSTLSTGDIMLNTGGGTATGTIGLTGAGTSYQVTISNISGQGTLGISIAANTASDLAGNLAPASDPSTTFTVYSNDATLSNLTTSAGTLDPSFLSATTAYTVDVLNETTSIKVTPTANNALISDLLVQVNGGGYTGVTSGNSSADLALNVGPNTIDIQVTAQDGTTVKTYTLTVNRAVSSEARLATLTLDPKTPMVQRHGTNYVDYTANVTSQTTSVTVTPVTIDNGATVTVNGATVVSGTASAPITLNNDTTAIATTVTAADGVTKKTYRLVVRHNPSGVATLGSLALNPARTLTKVSGDDYADYTTTVFMPLNTVNITAMASDNLATITINGVATTSGVQSGPIALNADTTAIAVTVTAPNGTTKKTYRIVVTRIASNDARLAKLALAPQTPLVKVSGDNYADYTTNVASQTTSIQVIPTTVESNSTVTVNGVPTVSGTASAPITLNADTTAIAVTVTAQDGVVKKTYRIMVSKQPLVLAILSSLTVSPGSPLVSVAGSDYRDYIANVTSQTTSVTVTPVAADNLATVTVNGTANTSGTASAPITLNIDTTAIAVTVTAPDGVTKNTYRVVVVRTPSAVAQLTSFTIKPQTPLIKVTGTDYQDYTTTVPNSTSSIKITAVTRDNTATITVNGIAVASGTETGAITLNADTTTIATTVTAQDGVTKNSYVILVTRQPLPPAYMAYNPVNEIPVESEQVTVHQNVSPNSDGQGDAMIIEGITKYPDNKLQIMSRTGNLVYEVKGYDNAGKVFDGHASNGKLQQAGTYFYSLEYKVGNETKRKTGYIVLKY